MSLTCENCGQQRAEDDVFCGHCGRQTGAMPVVPSTGPGTGSMRMPEEPPTIRVDVKKAVEEAAAEPAAPEAGQAAGAPGAYAETAVWAAPVTTGTAPQEPAAADPASSAPSEPPLWDPSPLDSELSGSALPDSAVPDSAVPDSIMPEPAEPEPAPAWGAAPPLSAQQPAWAQPTAAAPDAAQAAVPATEAAQSAPAWSAAAGSGQPGVPAPSYPPQGYQAPPSYQTPPPAPSYAPQGYQAPPSFPPPLGGLPPAPPGPPVPRAAARGIEGSATSAYYLGERLAYDATPEPSFDPLINRRFYIALLRQWAVFTLIYGIAAVVTVIPSLIIPGLIIVWGILAPIIWIAMWIVYLCIPVPALLSEWKFLVDDKGAAWQATLEHTYYALQRRATPLDTAGVRRLSLPGGEARDYLELKREIFTGYISSFPHGHDLYVGWTFWLRLSPGRVWWRTLVRIWHSLTGKNNDLYDTLRYESAKAMREAMHSAVHEGIETASAGGPAGGGGYGGLAISTTQITDR